MSYIEYHATQKDRVCKLCNCHMVRGTWGIVMREIHVPQKLRDIHFHEGCFARALDAAKADYPQKLRDCLAQQAKETRT